MNEPLGIALIGCGTVGTSVVQGARLAHASPLLAEHIEWALSSAPAAGALNE